MRNRYAAAAGTYPQRLFANWRARLADFIVPAVILSLIFQSGGLRQTVLDLHLLMLGAFVIGLLAFHLRQLGTDAKSRLLPRPMRAALIVTGACAGAYLIGFPLLMNLSAGVPLLWSAALLWIWSAAGFHAVIRPSLPLAAVLALALMVNMLSLVDTLPLKTWLAAANYPPVGWLLLLASIAWFAIVTRWLLQMNEESRGYTALSSGQKAWKARETSTEQTNRPWQDPNRSWWLRFNSPGERQMNRLVRYSGSANIFVRCRRWQLGGWQQYMPCVFAMAVLVPPLFKPNPSLFDLMLMPVFFAMAMPNTQRLQQWRTLANGLLKPISREDYLHEMGLCLAIDMARNLAVVFVVTLSFTLLVSPSDFRAAIVLPCLLVIALAGIFSFGAIVWLLRYRSMLALCAPYFVIMIPYLMLALDSLIPSMRWIAPCTAAILALIGLWLARDAYRRWLLTDLG